MSVKLAVIDTGINCDHPWLDKCVVGGIGIVQRNMHIEYVATYEDIVGHGTSVASVVHAFCPEVPIYGIRISQEVDGFVEGRTSEAVIVAAINWCVVNGIRIINISYSLDDTVDDGGLKDACKAAYENGCIVLGSYKSDGGMYYPAAYPTVIGVYRSMKCTPGQVKIISQKNRDVATWGGPLDVAFKDGLIAHLKGASYGCPSVAAMIARMCMIDEEISFERAFEFLEEMSMSDTREKA